MKFEIYEIIVHHNEEVLKGIEIWREKELYVATVSH